MKQTIRPTLISSILVFLLGSAVATAQPPDAPMQDIADWGDQSMMPLLDESQPEIVPTGPVIEEETDGERVFPLMSENPGVCDTCGTPCGADGECALCAIGPCCSVCGGGSCCPPLWYTEHGVRMLARSKPREQVLSQALSNLTTFNNRLTNRQMVADIAAGYTMMIGRYLGRDAENRDQFLEFTFWGLNTWTDDRRIPGPTEELTISSQFRTGVLFTGFATDFVGFSWADEQNFEVGSYLNNFELNLRLSPRSRADQLVLQPNGRWQRRCRPGHYCDYQVGLRLMSFDEDFHLYSHSHIAELDSTTGDPTGETLDAEGNYRIRTHNDLFGFQIGFDYAFRSCRWSYGVRAKAGPFLNFSDQLSRVSSTQFAGGVPEPFDELVDTSANYARNARKNGAAVIAELGFHGTYKIRPTLQLNAGYDLMWVSGLALATEQMRFSENPPSIVNQNGTVYMHGLTLSLEWLW